MGVVSDVRRWSATAVLGGFIAAPPLRRQPHHWYRALRTVAPVLDSPIGVWVLSRHAEVSAALRTPTLGNDERKADLSTLRLGLLERLPGQRAPITPPGPNAFFEVAQHMMLFLDQPDHTRLRSLVNKAFTPRRVEQLEVRIADLVAARLAGFDGRMELMADLAYPVPALVICELLGAPESDAAFIARHAPALASRLDPGPMRTAAIVEASNAAVTEVSAYIRRLIDDRRADPGDDLLSALLTAEEAGDRLSSDELVATLLLLLIAGHETTANLVGNSMVALLRRPAAWEQLVSRRDDAAFSKTAVDELLRFDGPIQVTERIALDDVTLPGGQVIPAGRIVVLLVAAANRDAAVFDRPDTLVLDRSPNPHVAFGGGAHFCVGAPLARLEARVMLRALAGLPDLRTESAVRWRSSFTIRGPEALHLRWGR